MKRLQLLLLTLLGTLGLQASPSFDQAKRYHIVCRQWTQGCVTDGNSANQQTPVYYLTTATKAEETYWIFTEEETNLYSIKNAKTGKYITYDGVRDTYRRYVSMTDQMDGEKSLWYIYQPFNGDDAYAIRNIGQYDHVWDVRTDSYMVGTYSRPDMQDISYIESFYFYDEEGNKAVERPANYTPEGFDVSSWLDATTESPDGWTFEGATWTDPGFGNYWNGEANVVSPFLERWNDTNYGPLPDTKMYQTLTTLPAGAYTLQADIIAVRQSGGGGWWGGQREEVGHDVWLFANDQRTEAGTNNESPKSYTVDVTLTKTGNINLGVSIENTNANWVATDNFMLLFHGTEEELMEGEKAKVRKELSDYYSNTEIEALIRQAGNDFYELEALRKSTSTMAGIDPLAKALKGLTIDGRAPVYVESLDLYLCTIPLANFGTDFEAVVNYEPREGYELLKIGAQAVPAGSTYTFKKVEGEKTYALRLQGDDGSSIVKYMTFTSLPVVKMYGSFNNNYQQGSIIVHEPDAPLPQLLNMKAKWRGGITNSNGKHKRNYHVKLLDENGEKLEKKFFGLRNDNSWILESCQVDMSRIRNRVLTDIWNDYSSAPYYIAQESKARTGTRGRFVELILNDEYRGIYCMTENMDRKQMKLKKYDEDTKKIHGQLWKSKDWSYAVFMGTRPDGGYYPKDFLSNPNGNSEMWDSYQVKYPALEDVSPTEWSTLYNAVDLVCSASDDNFVHSVSDYFDMPVVIDYYILMETILSTDNHGKNMFFAVYDKAKSSKITFGVWDMDATCGQRWSDDYWHQSFLGPEQDYAQFISNYEHGDYNLFRRLRNTDANDFNMKVRKRYRDLRQGPLATENILNRFRMQLNEFKTCGAAQREYDKWSYDSDVAYRQLDFDNEMDYLEDWFTRRMNYLDTKRFDIGSLPSDIMELATDEQPQQGVVYDLRGRIVGLQADLEQIPAGVYIINGKKIVKK